MEDRAYREVSTRKFTEGNLVLVKQLSGMTVFKACATHWNCIRSDKVAFGLCVGDRFAPAHW